MGKTQGYRPDIDGLRALAIVPVLLYHARVPGVTGGFVGVDVFFVISGYLITRIIAREIDAGDFSILRFYERRARRILPALVPMLVAVLGVAAWLYLPGDFGQVPRSALAATLFASNFWFFHETGYFAPAAETMPLLHSWSLAVEEQFYIGFPLLLLLVARIAPQWRRTIVGAVAAGSLALAILLQGDRSGFAFYLLPTRAWELFAGGLLALGALPEVRSAAVRSTLATAGIAALLAPVFLYDDHTPFPGATALPPVLGTVLLIHCAPGTRIGRLLATPPLVGIGLISYSLYLWHWPLIVFAQYARDARLEGVVQLAVIAAAFLLAWLSWRFVETPFRDARRVPRRRILAGAAVSLAALAAGTLALLPLGGWSQRFGPEVARMAAAKDDVSPVRKHCHDSYLRGAADCVLGAPGAAPSALLWGDSHGVEFAWVLGRQMARSGGALVERTHSSCPPLLDYASPHADRCAQDNAALLARIEANPAIRTVYLAAFWASAEYADALASGALDRTLARLTAAGRRVVLIGAVPPNRFDVPRRLARLAAEGRLAAARGRDRADFAATETLLGDVAALWQGRGVTYLDPAETLCDAARCALLAGGQPLYFDFHHPSLAGARLILAGLPPARPIEHAAR